MDIIMKKIIKPVEFEVKVVFKGEVYLRVADVCKVFGYKTQKAFIADYSDKVIKIKGCGNCIKQSDYNEMLEADEDVYAKQEMKEVTKVSDARIEYNGSKKMMGLKMIFGLQGLALAKHMSVDEYIEKIELPKNREQAVSDVLNSKNNYATYVKDIAKIKDAFSDVEQYGLQLRFVTKESERNIDFRAYLVGNGVVLDVTNFDDCLECCEYDKLYINEAGNLILPFYNWDEGLKGEINLSETKIDRDFRQYGMVENLLYLAQEQIAYKSTLDGDYISYDEDVLSLYIETEFVLAMMKPEDSRYTYYSGIAEVEVLDDIVCM